MRTARRAAAAALSTVLLAGGSALVCGPATALADAGTCQGLPVTVEGIVGTEGDDVMLARLDAGRPVLGLGGNDTICLVDGSRQGSRDPMYSADAGPGDDVVVSQATYPTVHLGAGADRYIGNGLGAYVYTGETAPISGGAGYFGQKDTEADVVVSGEGRDSVYSGDTTGFLPNPDRIATGGSDASGDTVYYAGRMTPDGMLDNGSSRDQVYLVGSWAPGLLSIDHVAGRADLAGTEVLRWSAVRDFVVPERPEGVRFVGGPDRDRITVGDYGLPTPGGPMSVDVRTGDGRDHVTLAGALQGRIGLGSRGDFLTLGGACDSTRAVLGSHLSCRQGSARSLTKLSGVENLLVVDPHIVAIGTQSADRIAVSGRASRVFGRGGPDRLDAFGRGSVVDGGRGRDRCSADTVRHCER